MQTSFFLWSFGSNVVLIPQKTNLPVLNYNHILGKSKGKNGHSSLIFSPV